MEMSFFELSMRFYRFPTRFTIISEKIPIENFIYPVCSHFDFDL